MTAITRASAVLDGIADRTLDGAKKIKIAQHYLIGQGVDVDGMTNEELAQGFLDKLFTLLKGHHMSAMIGQAQRANAAAEAIAQAEAETDFD